MEEGTVTTSEQEPLRVRTQRLLRQTGGQVLRAASHDGKVASLVENTHDSLPFLVSLSEPRRASDHQLELEDSTESTVRTMFFGPNPESGERVLVVRVNAKKIGKGNYTKMQDDSFAHTALDIIEKDLEKKANNG